MYSEDTDVKLNPDLQYMTLLRDTVVRPVFIMGDHRSGTTLLYRLLDQTQCFNVVRAYHIIRYGEILSNYFDKIEDHVKMELSAYFSQLGVTDRMIDGVAVTPDLPEEYGIRSWHSLSIAADAQKLAAVRRAV